MNPSRWLVPSLSLTLLLSWGSLYYAFAMLVGPVQTQLQWSATSTMGAYSTALVTWGLCAYPVGRLIDRYGARPAMTLGSYLCGVLLVSLSATQSIWVFYLVWTGLGAGMGFTLYEPAFAALVHAWPGAYRRRIGVLTLAGGLASTVFWPLTHLLASTLGWRTTVLVYGLVHLFICAPLHGCLLPARPRGRAKAVADTPASGTGPAMRSAAFWLLAFSLVAFGFVTSAMAMHVVPMLESTGATPAMALAIAALVGPIRPLGRSLAGGAPSAARDGHADRDADSRRAARAAGRAECIRPAVLLRRDLRCGPGPADAGAGHHSGRTLRCRRLRHDQQRAERPFRAGAQRRAAGGHLSSRRVPNLRRGTAGPAGLGPGRRGNLRARPTQATLSPSPEPIRRASVQRSLAVTAAAAVCR